MLPIDDLKDAYPDISLDIWEMLESMDAYTYNHSIRVCEICRLVEKELGYTDTHLSEAGLLHDIGKYCYSRNILEKPSSLNLIERQLIDVHSFLSSYILKHYHFNEEICEIAMYHHNLEPIFLDIKIASCSNDNIIKKAKILKTIDIFEALTTDRPYHRGISNEKAIEELRIIPGCDAQVIDILANTKGLDR